jgi:hypothetical protein
LAKLWNFRLMQMVQVGPELREVCGHMSQVSRDF